MHNHSLRQLSWLGLSILTVLIDQWTKVAAVQHLTYAESVPVIPHLLSWTLLYNHGAAFSFLSNAGGWQRWVLTGLAVVASLGFAVWLMRLPRQAYVLAAALALIIGGALGNLIDRIQAGYVVDFIHFYWNDYHFPAFNIADSAITLGTLLLLIDSIFLSKKSAHHNEANR